MWRTRLARREVARYIGRHGSEADAERLAKAVLTWKPGAAVFDWLEKLRPNPGGLADDTRVR